MIDFWQNAPLIAADIYQWIIENFHLLVAVEEVLIILDQNDGPTWPTDLEPIPAC